jgi:hypothetical protein
MIGETAYERKPGGRRLGTIVGQRTADDAEGQPIEQWEIRSRRGIKFFMSKADVRLAAEPEPEREPEKPAAPPKVGAQVRAPVAAAPRRYRSTAPAAITAIGVALCAACAALYALGLPRRLSEDSGLVIGLIPGFLGLILIMVGTNLIEKQARDRALEDAE